MGGNDSIAARLADGDSAIISEVAQVPLVPRKDNLVERPWGGNLLRKFKGLDDRIGPPIGESFEISACPGDAEANQWPSIIRFEDGSELPLPEILATAGEDLLGPGFHSEFPLLPKLLDIKELLSIQGHPPGNTEVYVIIQADAGASLRLGFQRDMDPKELGERLQQGRRLQQALLAEVAGDFDGHQLQAVLAPWLAQRTLALDDLPARLRGAKHLSELHQTYWWVLDALNRLPVQAGQVIFNANPDRVLAPGVQPSAEVHALGNPEGAEILALEIRKPGPTMRAWDNVRFPIRDTAPDAAVEALNLKATGAADFMMEKIPLDGQSGISRSVDCEDYCIDHIALDDAPVAVANTGVHCLHVVAGALEWVSPSRRRRLIRGESAIVPHQAGDYQLVPGTPAEVVKVTLRSPGR